MDRFTDYKNGWRVLGDGAYMADGLSIRGEAIDRLADYEDAEAEGRLIVLPCKVGDMVWSGEPFVDKCIREGVIVQINIDAFGFCGFWASFNPCAIAAEFIKEDIGKTVFFTREEAEAALKEDKP